MTYIPKTLPAFTYTGTYATELRADWGWVIRFKTSGTLTFTDRNRKIDAFLVGGGGGGGGAVYGSNEGLGGGGGGYTAMQTGLSVKAGTAYSIVVGAGGTAGNSGSSGDGGAGKASSAFGLSAAGGKGGMQVDLVGGDGGSGGGAGGPQREGIDPNQYAGEKGGSNGASGGGSTASQRRGGKGAGLSTYEFRTAGWPLYAGGGGGGGSGRSGVGNSHGPGGKGGSGGGGDGGAAHYYNGDHAGRNGAANTGGGGGGAGAQNGANYTALGGAGGSGIVCIRNSPDDVLPVVFNGTWLTRLVHNGTDVASLIYDGTRLFTRCGKGDTWRRNRACMWAGWRSAGC